ncbi:MAG: glycosyltransferase family 2 protein [Kiritimatiellia bacterium]|jgi:GT2 family glycosyltransferase|nr:glycosyltransferase family 2 protein [Kiritimatiellia bacterium]
MMPPFVSVIIPTYNRARTACDCVASVLRSDYREIEVILVDDASPDNTRDLVESRFGSDPRVRYVRNETNLQPAGGRNRGADLAKGEYLLFVDDDNLVEPDMVSKLVRGMSLDSALGQIAPLAIHKAPNLIWTLGSTFNLWTSQPKNLHEREPADRVALEDRLYPSWYSPNVWMVKKEAFDRIGGCDPFYRIMFDESDFGMRLRRAGYRSAIYPMARTYHLGFLEPGKTAALRGLGIESPERAYCFARNRSVFVRRHFPPVNRAVVLTVFVPLFAVYYGAVALRHRRPDIAWAFLKGTFAGWFSFPREPRGADAG